MHKFSSKTVIKVFVSACRQEVSRANIHSNKDMNTNPRLVNLWLLIAVLSDAKNSLFHYSLLDFLKKALCSMF